jgi:hypothetical protein
MPPTPPASPGTNSLEKFCGNDTGTNLLSDAAYLADAERLIGHQPGIARSQLENKALRGATLVSAMIGRFIAAWQVENIADDRDPLDLMSLFIFALRNAVQPDAASETLSGIVELADGAETLAQTVDTKAVSPFRLKDAFPRSFSSSGGYVKLPGGFIVQWGNVLNEGKTTSKLWPIAFPVECFVGFADVNLVPFDTRADPVVTDFINVKFDPASPSFFRFSALDKDNNFITAAGAYTCSYIAIGR